MFPSYQTVPLANVSKANAPKDERSSTPVPRMKKVAVAAMVGVALVVVGYSYSSSTTHPAKIDIATTTMTTTTAAANLVRGGVRNGDAGQEDFSSYCSGEDETACKGKKECHWYAGIFSSYCACAWTEQLTQCMGLTKYPALTTAEACKNACCDDKNCGVWQFSAADYVNQCWYGTHCNNKGRLIWEYGGIRTGGGLPGAKCENNSDCAIPPGLDHGVCLETYCQPGTSRSICEVTNDCVKPPGLNHPVCRDGRCQMGGTGSGCGVTSDCVVPSGLDHPVCRGGHCQSGASGSKCGATSDCVVPQGLEHPVCRVGKCQRGVLDDYCGQDSDCIAGFHCDSVASMCGEDYYYD